MTECPKTEWGPEYETHSHNRSFGGAAALPCGLRRNRDRCAGVRVRGTKYVCEDAEITNAFPVGVSNVWEAEEAEITVKSGILAVIQSRLQKGEHI